MKIVKCSKCGRYIHEASKCFYCGNTSGFNETEMPTIHENVVVEYSRIESLLATKKFDTAYRLSHDVIEWMPNFANVFWLRLLAKNKSTCTAELIQKGFNCEDDADFCNALAFSTGTEHSVYLDIQNLVFSLKKALKTEVQNHEYQCKIKTNVLKIKKGIKGEVDARKEKLFSLWSALEETEQSMYMLEKDCFLRSKEHIDTLDNAARRASSIKVETYRLEECTDIQFHEYQMKIGNILQCSEQAKKELRIMKEQHPWVKSFNDLSKKRDEQIRAITNEIFSLRMYESAIQQTLDEINRIKERHRLAVRALERYDFLDAANLLGKDCYNNILRSTGLYAELQVPISSQDWTPIDGYTATIDNSNDVESDNDYTTWNFIQL